MLTANLFKGKIGIRIRTENTQKTLTHTKNNDHVPSYGKKLIFMLSTVTIVPWSY